MVLRQLNLTIVRLGMVFGRWEYDTGVRDTLSMALQLLEVAEKGGEAVVHKDSADDWVYSVDVAIGLVAILDLPDAQEPIYHLATGVGWSIQAWCERLRERFPSFQFRLTERQEECTLGRNKAARRSPMDIARIRRDANYEPAYMLDRAFDDFIAWRSAVGPYSLDACAL